MFFILLDHLVISILIVSVCGNSLIGSSFRTRRAATEVHFSYKTFYYEQPVDHFNPFKNDTFKIRYLLNNDSWDSNGGPILFYPGGEGDITWFCNNTGLLWDIAPEFKAMIVFAEHRYYGESLPYGTDSYTIATNLGYLNIEQAMADFAQLLQNLKETIPGASKSPVLAFGGSYGGMLAAWMRMQYPHFILGSLASSAPILEFSDMNPCGSFCETVTKDFEAVSSICSNTIRKSWAAIDRVAKKKSGRHWLGEKFKLCQPVEDQSNLAGFKDWLANAWVNLAEVNYPYATSFLQDLPSWPITKACKYLTNDSTSDKNLISQIQKAANFFYNFTGKVPHCFNYTKLYLDPYIKIGWDFQSCTEIAMPFCSDNVNDMFEPNEWNFNSVSDSCFHRWGVRPDPKKGYRMFGGRDIQAASNIIFTNGEFDPWKGYGILQNYSASVISILIKSAAHHLDLRSAHKDDLPSVIQARNLSKELFRQWINEYRHFKQDSSPDNASLNSVPIKYGKRRSGY